MPESTDDPNNSRTGGTVLVLSIVAVILAFSGLWFYSAIWSAGKASPTLIEEAAKEAERDCVLMGGGYEQCKQLVGKHHSDCRDQHLVSSDAGGQTLDREGYLTCMETAFQQEGLDP